MRKKSLIALLAVLPLVFACGHNARKTDAGPQERHIPELLAAVPSDALAVICHNRCTEGLQFYDSTSVLHRLDLSAFKHAKMALSLCYNGSLVPVLALDTGRAPADSSEAVRDLLAQAASLRLRTECVPPDADAKHDGFVLITPSDAQLAAVRRHLAQRTSVLDAPGFRQALEAAGTDQFIIFRGSGAERVTPKGWLQGIFPRRDLTAFLRSIADRTVIRPEGNSLTVLPVCDASDTFYANILGSLPWADSRLDGILPADTRFALALPVVLPELRSAVERYQDASVKLTRYNKALEELRKASGKDPLKWEKEIKIQEIALVHFAGGAVTLARAGKTVADRAPEENPWQGFLPALYGSAFALPDDSVSAVRDGWYIYGSLTAVQAFLDAERPENGFARWPGKGCRFVLYEPEKTLAWDKKGIKLIWNTNR